MTSATELLRRRYDDRAHAERQRQSKDVILHVLRKYGAPKGLLVEVGTCEALESFVEQEQRLTVGTKPSTSLAVVFSQGRVLMVKSPQGWRLPKCLAESKASALDMLRAHGLAKITPAQLVDVATVEGAYTRGTVYGVRLPDHTGAFVLQPGSYPMSWLRWTEAEALLRAAGDTQAQDLDAFQLALKWQRSAPVAVSL